MRKLLIKLGIIKEYPVSIYRDKLGRTIKVIMNGKTIFERELRQ